MRKVLRIGEKGKVKLDRAEREATSDLRTKVAQLRDQVYFLCIKAECQENGPDPIDFLKPFPPQKKTRFHQKKIKGLRS